MEIKTTTNAFSSFSKFLVVCIWLVRYVISRYTIHKVAWSQRKKLGISKELKFYLRAETTSKSINQRWSWVEETTYKYISRNRYFFSCCLRASEWASEPPANSLFWFCRVASLSQTSLLTTTSLVRTWRNVLIQEVRWKAGSMHIAFVRSLARLPLSRKCYLTRFLGGKLLIRRNDDFVL